MHAEASLVCQLRLTDCVMFSPVRMVQSDLWEHLQEHWNSLD